MVSESILTGVILAAAIIIVNITEITYIIKAQKNLSLFQLLLLSLAVADLLVGLSELFLSILEWHGVSDNNLRYRSILCFAVAASVNHVNAITVDRLIAVRWPLKHRYLISRRSVAIYVALTWGVSVLMLMPLVISDGMEYASYILSIFIFTDAAAMVLIYPYIIYRAVVVRRRALKAVAQTSENAARQRKEVQLVILIILTAIFMLCSLPYCFFAMTADRVPKPIKMLLVANSLCNPFVYLFWKILQAKLRASRSAATQLNVTRTSH